jgi:hypothetical protein
MFRHGLLLSLIAIGSAIQLHAETGVRILLGVTDQTPTQWDGSVTADSGQITRITPWRFNKDDEITGTSWKASTRPALSFLDLILHKESPVSDNGVIVWLNGENDNTRLSVKTTQGEFSFRLGDLPYGTFQYALSGRVSADRIPPSWQITNTREEEDYPATAVARNGDIWLAYLTFHHAPNHDQLTRALDRSTRGLLALQRTNRRRSSICAALLK